MLKSLERPDGRRLVGSRRHAHPKTGQITNQLIAAVIREAVRGLSEHCEDIEEKIAEK